MAKKLQNPGAAHPSAAFLAESVKASSEQIWLAGLGAFAKAQEERGKVFEALVKEGLSVQRQTQAVAEEKILEATSRMADMVTDLSAKATGITSLATGQWDKLETLFEDRVAKALHKLGMPSSNALAELALRLDELARQVQALSNAMSNRFPETTPTAAAAQPVRRRSQARKAALAKPAGRAG
jgi:poly(hydroxyalkanoate) granule-associated protein